MALNGKNPTEKQKTSAKEDYTTNKVLFFVAICLFGILYLMMLKRLLSYGSTFMFGYNFVRGVGVASVIGCYLGYWKRRRERRKRIDTTYVFFSGKNIMKFFFFMILVHGYITYYYLTAINTLYFILPAVAVLYVILHVYQREFFVIALDCALGAGLLWVVGKGIANPDKVRASLIAIITMAFITIVQLILIHFAAKQDGYISPPREYLEAQMLKDDKKAIRKGDGSVSWRAVQYRIGETEEERKVREKRKLERIAAAREELERTAARENKTPMFTTDRGKLILILTPIALLAIHLCAYFIFSNTYYLMFAIIAYFLVTAVYYTVKIL